MGNYDHLPKSQAITLEYGSRIRAARALKGMTRCHLDTFTQDEQDLVATICEDAEKRAKATYDEARRSQDTKQAATDSRAQTEPRQYTGK